MFLFNKIENRVYINSIGYNYYGIAFNKVIVLLEIVNVYKNIYNKITESLLV